MLIPVQKKFNKPKMDFGRGRPSQKKQSLKPHVSLRALWIVFGVFALFYGVFLIFKYTLFVPEYTITNIDYSASNIQTYDDPYLYKTISTLIKWENYRVVEWSSNTILQQIQVTYPFVKSFDLLYKWPNRVFVKVSFDEPRLIVFQWNFRYAVYDQKFFQLFSGNTLGSGALHVELFPTLLPPPSTAPVAPVVVTGSHLSGASASGIHLSGTTVTGTHLSGNAITGVSLPVPRAVPSPLTWLFYQEPFDHFIDTLQIINQAFSNAKYFQYLVGGQRIIVGLPNDRIVYINLLVDINLQLQNYLYLKQYYSDFSKLKEIDLWSIEMDKVIVRK